MVATRAEDGDEMDERTHTQRAIAAPPVARAAGDGAARNAPPAVLIRGERAFHGAPTHPPIARWTVTSAGSWMRGSSRLDIIEANPTRAEGKARSDAARYS